ncbi:hypothetical protein OAU50_04320 [Planctomycetota bacterium]|nr:hypothetical protein [Planctomycetota bacterium]
MKRTNADSRTSHKNRDHFKHAKEMLELAGVSAKVKTVAIEILFTICNRAFKSNDYALAIRCVRVLIYADMCDLERVKLRLKMEGMGYGFSEAEEAPVTRIGGEQSTQEAA